MQLGKDWTGLLNELDSRLNKTNEEKTKTYTMWTLASIFIIPIIVLGTIYFIFMKKQKTKMKTIQKKLKILESNPSRVHRKTKSESDLFNNLN